MTHAGVRTDGGARLFLDEEDLVAFVDRDWIWPNSSRPVPALRVDTDGQLWWLDRRLDGVSGEPQAHVGALIGAFADDVLAATAGIDPNTIRVTGTGVIAAEIRSRLGNSDGASSERPGAVIETTGDGAALTTACNEVRDRGLILLAGEPAGEVDIDLYRDVHRRGLQMLGIPGLGHSRDVRVDVSRRLAEPCTVAAGDELPSALWYRVKR
jgi:hypothetical protein